MSCTAVGDYKARGNYHALAEHWDGSTWTVQTAVTPPGVAFAELFGIWCASAANCTATGYYTTGVTSGPGQALVEHWDGSAWTIEPAPANPPGSYVSILDAVSCTSAASCTAVGASLYVSSPTSRTLAERWNGSRWTIETTARPSGSIEDGLSGVSCTSSASCTAVGAYTKKPDTGLTLAEHWNGSTWTVQQTAFPPRHKVLNALSCTSASACTAVGGSSTASEPFNDRPVAEHE